MDAASLALGVCGLYGVIKQCITVISRAQNFSKQAAKLRVKYLIEEVRLQHWAQNWGCPDGALMDPNLKAFSPALHQVAIITLLEIYNTLQDTAKLRDRYGIDSPLSGSTTSQATPPLLSRSSTLLNSISRDDLSLSVVPDRSRITAQLSDTRPTSITIPLLRRTMWAISGATKFEALVKDLREWNDSLACFQPRRQQESADLALMATLIQQRGGDQISVPQIMGALEEDGPAELSQTASLKRYNEFLEANVLKLPDAVRRRDLYLLPANFSLDDSSKPGEGQDSQTLSCHWRQFGTYRAPALPGSNPVPVLVEWKIVPKDIKAEYKSISKSRIQNIALLLHETTKKPKEFFTHPCIGIISASDGTQGLVFKLPPSTTEIDPSTVQPYCSLHELLPDTGTESTSIYEPPLQHRFSLAMNLASGFLTCHASAVVHKRFSSHDVLFSHPLNQIIRSEESPGLQKPVITGFGFSRPVDDEFGSISVDAIPSVAISNDALSALGQSLYAHHSVIGRSPVGFSAKFDIYSLGLVLLEVGLWTRLEDLLPSRNTLRRLGIEGPVFSTKVFIEAFHDTLIARYLPRLNRAMGGIYGSAVIWCLVDQFKEDPAFDEEAKTQEAFYWRVINELSKCNV
ncbi:Protein kinase-like (PK-like) [Glarea lozoyensis ATCC 20868]|uniref:Protein kinase-like (PK-like) n=1 Tax=Glarea lozoyensis (strain ATCC 20868 / MF5171) TaxID=1116229 RepID=S3CQQ8_GLAL2|nr:Protein kinase-like (PK-like) [Glarea lozoyensis ATCC 20868]EPE28020.1 Protein kinase-like (PK-like) [Glarea lozoyensis ATCC 20868]